MDSPAEPTIPPTQPTTVIPTPPTTTPSTDQTNPLSRSWPIVYKLALFLGFAALLYWTLITPYRVVGDPLSAFANSRFVLTDKLTFLFREPKVNDPIIFLNQDPNQATNNPTTSIGVITNIENNNNIRKYHVFSTPTQDKPWSISRDKIIAHIYYPPVAALPPTPSPAPDPTAGWQNYSIKELAVQFKLPPTIAQLGDFRKVTTPSETGSQDCWSLGMPQGSLFVKPALAGGGSCGVHTLTIGRTSADHSAGRMGGFADAKQFAVNRDLPPDLVKLFTNDQGVEILIIKGANGGENDFPLIGSPGEGAIGALIKTNDQDFPVLTLQMPLTNELTKEIFNQILSTFEFTQNSNLSTESQIKKAVENYLVKQNVGLENFNVLEINKLGSLEDVYIVSFTTLPPGSDYGGEWTIVGQVNNQWVAPDPSSATVCSWVNSAFNDENDIAYYGQACQK